MPTSNKTKIIIITIATALIMAMVILLYRQLDPSEWAIFPKCPFKLLTGYDCPGCGSQRAIHALLNGEFAKAFSFNPLLIIALPYIILAIIINISPNKPQWMYRIDNTLYHGKAVTVWAVIIIVYTILRNTPLYPFAT